MSNTTKNNPCLGCTERWVDVENGTSCHSTCERHKAAKAEHDERKRKIIERRNEEGIYEGYRRVKLARYRHTREGK